MRANKGTGVKPKAVTSSQTAVCFSEDSNLSAIEKASFLEGLQQMNDDPLHSTAIEDELTPGKTGQMGGVTDGGPRGKTRLPVAARKRKNQDQDPGVSKRGRPGTQQKVQARPEPGGVKGQRTKTDRSGVKAVPPTGLQSWTSAQVRGLTRKNTVQGAGAGGPNPRSTDRKSVKEKIRSRPGGSGSPQDSDLEQQSCGSDLSSGEDQDTSWKPEPQGAAVQRFGRGRDSGSKGQKSSSGGGRDQGVTGTSAGMERRRKGHGPHGTDLELVLEAFLRLCHHYSESVESRSLRDLVHRFCSSVEEELSEKITLIKDLRSLKRENTKVSSLIRSKTQKLLEAKNELMRQERGVLLLQKEESELTLRLADLRRSHSFLGELRQLSQRQEDQQQEEDQRQQEDQRQEDQQQEDQRQEDQQQEDQRQEDQQQPQPRERETYGASSLPALVLEARHIQTTEQQLRSVNQRLETRLDQR